MKKTLAKLWLMTLATAVIVGLIILECFAPLVLFALGCTALLVVFMILTVWALEQLWP